ncbi:hypothetical protein E5163_06930 [Marinicauda algicola]|uniref:Glycine zipper domain-containing protein n=2 Tax=Marinicauda algicola TaxID=2029849 RepID=A0A4S2H028_9PROT|nr:glycine zipper domain-containing protein [Marinicauda algicola]TGY88865.1 hypothetical protein E5163_06930 [Marinicauda algicola]
MLKYLTLAVSAAALAACANNSALQGAAIGGAAGAAAGAIIGNNVGSGDAETGALIGGAIGAAGGAYAGCQRDGGCGWSRNNPNQSELQWDPAAQRYYYTDLRTGDTYWQNGTPRTRYRPRY